MLHETTYQRPFTTTLLLIMVLFVCALPLMEQVLYWNVLSVLLMPFGILNFMLSWLVFSNSITYTVVCVGILGFSGWALIQARLRWWQRVLLLLSSGIVLLFMTWPYAPSVQPASGYTLTLATKPALFANGMARAQAIGEHKPCRYEILGWYADTLFYNAQCRGALGTYWHFNPQQMTAPQRYRDTLPPLEIAPLGLAETHELISAFASYPPDADLRSIYVKNPGFQSSTGEWTAMVSSYLYAREDIILISPKQ